MNRACIASAAGFNAAGNSFSQILQNLIQGVGVFDYRDSIAACAMKNEIPGRIPWEWVESFDFTNKVVKNGPIEARYAYIAVSRLLSGLEGRKLDSECGLFCGTMNNSYGMVGLRNGYRICATPDLRYEKTYFEQRIAQGFGYVHPMVPVYKIPNNVIANVALDFGLGGDNANFFGEDSSAVALQAAFERVRYGYLRQALVFSANHLFLNYLDFLMLDPRDLFRKTPVLKPEEHSLSLPTEAASACLITTLDDCAALGLEPRAEILAVVQRSNLGSFYQRTVLKEEIEEVISEGLIEAEVKFSDLDLILFDNLDRDCYQAQVLHDLKSLHQADTLLSTPHLYVGHPLCATTLFLTLLALEMMHSQQTFSSYRNSVHGYLDSGSKVDIRKVGILTQSYNNSLQFIVLTLPEIQ